MTTWLSQECRNRARLGGRGPLLPVKTELYQNGIGIEALRALANLAHLAGRKM